ncbi:hypothetical protein IH992_15830 [Candidatus Poribacteria bacterium]|nr:hypothetical protein [Candidatus Poribacteria bacterium]
MKLLQFSTLLMCVMVLTFGVAYLATAQNYIFDSADPLADPPAGDALARDDSGETNWITKWLALDGQVTNNGGFAVSGPIDWLDEGTSGAVTQESISTVDGLLAAKDVTLTLPDNGGGLNWGIFDIDPADGNNMSSMYGLADESNFDTYAIIVIGSSNNRDAVIAAAHDDFAQIWVNGDKVYNNSVWTGAAQQVNFDIPISLNKGANVLLYRCGESGGSDYYNLRFADGGAGLSILPETDNVDDFWRGVTTAVEPGGKLPTIWGDIKRQNR